MIKEAIEKILTLAPANLIEIEGRKYSDKALSPVKSPEIEPLKFSTLNGLIEFVQSNTLKTEHFFIHIVSPTNVMLYGAELGLWKKYEVYAIVTAISNDFRFGAYYPAEEFIIKLSTQFDLNFGDADSLLKLVANVREENVRQTRDDGISQEVTVRKGAKFESTEIPRLVSLAPYRTFREIEQPLSPFMPRAKDGPQFALFDAAGDLWKLQTVGAIKKHLSEKLRDILILC